MHHQENQDLILMDLNFYMIGFDASNTVIVCEFFGCFSQEDITGNDRDQCVNQSEFNNDSKCATEIRTPSSDEEEIKDESNSEDDAEAGITCTNREVEEVMQDVARKNCGSSNTYW